MYRRTTRYQARRRAWHPRQPVPADAQRAAVPSMVGQLRKLLITVELDCGDEPILHCAALYGTRRVDSYSITWDGVPWHLQGRKRVGWSGFLDALRRAIPRHLSPRRIED